MPNPTRQEIIAAHEALEDLDDTACNLVEDQDDKDLWELWKKRILAALPPRPQPTMAEIEWDDNKHLLTEADHSGWGKVVMLSDDVDGYDYIEVLRKYHGKNKRDYAHAEDLTPTGRKFALKEANNE